MSRGKEEGSLAIQLQTQMVASIDVCGSVFKYKLAKANSSAKFGKRFVRNNPSQPECCGSPCPTIRENDAIPSTVMNHKNRSHEAGILLAASLSKNLP
jgi:hypothetical protein